MSLSPPSSGMRHIFISFIINNLYKKVLTSHLKYDELPTLTLAPPVTSKEEYYFPMKINE